MASTTTNLLIPLIAGSQNNKEITFNTAIDELDEAMDANIVETMGNLDLTLPPDDFASAIFFTFVGSMGGVNRNVILPSGQARLIIVLNTTTDSPTDAITFKVGAGTKTVTVGDYGVPHMIYSDGVNSVYKVS